MKLKSILSCLAAVLLSASAAFASTLADWTFETSQPGVVDLPASPGAGVWITNIVAEIGSGTASGLHAGAATYSSSAGNGSSHSFSANTWAVGDCYQFAVSTVGAKNVVVTFDQIGSSTGPGKFNFTYSTDGVNFTNFGSTYTVITNSGSTTWSAGTPITQSSYTNDLSSITVLNNAPVVYFRLVTASTVSVGGGTIGASGTCRVDNFSVTASTGSPPAISGVSPSTFMTNAGNTANFTVTMSAGDTPLTYYWYKETASATNLISTVTSSSSTNILTLPNVLFPDAANYQAVVSNASTFTATSTVVSLTVIDPAINVQPVSQTGLLNGMVQFPVSAGGTGLSYKWYFCKDPQDNTQISGQVNNGTLGSGAVVSGATTNTLTISNLTTTAPTNFVVVVTGTYGAVTSSVASLAVANTGPLAFWNFNSSSLNITNPATYQGIGTASSTNIQTFQSPTSDANDPGSPVSAWGTQNYPAQGTLNKQAGVQFNASTAGAKNIVVSYDVRGSATASGFQRLQFTTNGTTWIDYPASSNLGGSTTFQGPRVQSLAGFPGVANNPNFGIRIVAEFESTAKYNDTNNANYAAVTSTSTYGTSGTLTYDLVSISADAITNNNAPPTISSIPDQTMKDTIGTQVVFTVSDDSTPAGSLGVTAASLDPNVSLSLTPQNTSGTVHLSINSSHWRPIEIDSGRYLSGLS